MNPVGQVLFIVILCLAAVVVCWVVTAGSRDKMPTIIQQTMETVG